MEYLAETERPLSLAIPEAEPYEEKKERNYKTPIYVRNAIKRWQVLHPEEHRLNARNTKRRVAHRKHCGCTAMNVCNEYMLMLADQQEEKRRLRILENGINELNALIG